MALSAQHSLSIEEVAHQGSTGEKSSWSPVFMHTCWQFACDIPSSSLLRIHEHGSPSSGQPSHLPVLTLQYWWPGHWSLRVQVAPHASGCITPSEQQ